MKDTVRCPWKQCAHGMAPAATDGEGCYAGKVEDHECKGFISDEDWDKWIDEKQRGGGGR